MTQPERDSNITPEIIRTIQEVLAEICAYTGKRFAVCAMDGDGAIDVFIIARDREAKSIADALGAKIRDAAHELTAAMERKHSKTSPTTTTNTTPPPRDKYSLS